VRPDVVFTRAKVAVFVDGCFWHSCPLHGTSPRSNRDYWGPKLARNAERDRANTVALRRDGWRVVRIWEHDDVETGLRAIEDALFSAGSP
jgi:DNA mismatch endonuclease, patch repair protein